MLDDDLGCREQLDEFFSHVRVLYLFEVAKHLVRELVGNETAITAESDIYPCRSLLVVGKRTLARLRMNYCGLEITIICLTS